MRRIDEVFMIISTNTLRPLLKKLFYDGALFKPKGHPIVAIILNNRKGFHAQTDERCRFFPF